MDILSSFLIFIISVIVCAVAGTVTRRKNIQLSRIGLIVFHAFYIVGMVSIMILL